MLEVTSNWGSAPNCESTGCGLTLRGFVGGFRSFLMTHRIATTVSGVFNIYSKFSNSLQISDRSLPQPESMRLASAYLSLHRHRDFREANPSELGSQSDRSPSLRPPRSLSGNEGLFQFKSKICAVLCRNVLYRSNWSAAC